jgi:hypothetical protein
MAGWEVRVMKPLANDQHNYFAGDGIVAARRFAESQKGRNGSVVDMTALPADANAKFAGTPAKPSQSAGKSASWGSFLGTALGSAIGRK